MKTLTAHDAKVDFPADQSTLKHLTGYVQVEGIRTSDRRLQLTVGSLFAAVLHLLVVCSDDSTLNGPTLVRMLAPKEKPRPKSGRLGNVFLAHFTNYESTVNPVQCLR